ncbi:MAG: septum formation protein Maf [Flavobacteriales bacterium]|nr:septum formation protein Maf [Flavobacteriales bacterium]
MWTHLDNKKIILGSKSPRRKELLENLGITFEVKTIEFDESYPKNIPISEITKYLAKKKASNYSINKNEILIVSDTIVEIDNRILEKPKTEQDAREMLVKLSNNSHNVHSSLGIKTDTSEIYLNDTTNVFFNSISEQEIEYYIKHYNVMDKAGSYGIQDWIGFAKIQKIEGSYYTVMGMPTHLLYEELQRIQ